MPSIFICYRRGDTTPYAGRLYDALVGHFGRERLFMDVDTIQPGDDFVEILDAKVSACDVLIALIGKQWVTSQDSEGFRRLDDPEDFVHLEIVTAMRRKIRVIPALVGGATMPRSQDLPESLKSLTRRQAIEISDTRFHRDVQVLIESLERRPDEKKIRSRPKLEDVISMSIEVREENKIEKKKLPFVIGVLADMTGDRESQDYLPQFQDRRFVEINRENFNDVLKGMRPRLNLKVANTLSGSELSLEIDLQFCSITDFSPNEIANMVEPLRQLQSIRKGLANLRAYLNSRLEKNLREILQNPSAYYCLDDVLEESVPSEWIQTAKSAGLMMQEVEPEKNTKTAKHEQPEYKMPLLQTSWEAERAAEEESLTFLTSFVRRSFFLQGDWEESEIKSWLASFFLLVWHRGITPSEDIESVLSSLIEDIDDKLSRQMDEIMHAPAFQELEATWRGLQYMIYGNEVSPHVKYRILNVSKQELSEDLLRKARERTSSQFFWKVYEEELGSPGGQPFSLLIGDYYFSNDPEDLGVLDQISYVAQKAYAPFLASAAPTMFGFKKLAEISTVRDLSKRFETERYTKWTALRRGEKAKYIGLVMPRMLMRQPYIEKNSTANGFHYHENSGNIDQDTYLWGNPVYSVAVSIANTFRQHEWYVPQEEGQNGMLSAPLPSILIDDKGGMAEYYADMDLAKSRQDELADLGFISWRHEPEIGVAVFDSLSMCEKMRNTQVETPNLSTWLSSQLISVLAISRVVHYLKAILRYKVNSYMSIEDLQQHLRDWISQYVGVVGSAGKNIKIAPLFKEGNIVLEEATNNAGSYRLLLSIQPQFVLATQLKAMRLRRTREQNEVCVSETHEIVLDFFV